MEVSAESTDNEPEKAVTVETDHREELSREAFDRELVKRVAEVNDLSEKHVASRRNVMLDMSELSVEPEDFTDG